MSKTVKIEYDNPVISVYNTIGYDHYVNDIKKYTFRMDTKNKLFIITFSDVSEKDKKEYIDTQINVLKKCTGCTDYNELIYEEDDDFYKNGLLSGYYFIQPLRNHYKINKLTGNFYHKKHPGEEDKNCAIMFALWTSLFLKYIKKHGYKI